MANDRNENTVSGNMPDAYDRMLDKLMGRQGVDATRPSMVRTVPLFGIGGVMSYSVQTFRTAGDILEEDDEKGTIKRGPAEFTVALEVAHGEVLRRIIVPHAVLDVIMRQRDSLTTTAMRRSAKATAKARKDRGIVPGFLKHKRKK